MTIFKTDAGDQFIVSNIKKIERYKSGNEFRAKIYTITSQEFAGLNWTKDDDQRAKDLGIMLEGPAP
ncbi:hypothetical protein ACSFBF_14815 [Variovorax sp. ZT5P49]|uniref:hypothetical protein n=1 Tax=Variovorax sp. ZT5P49 TaxID=3443733 RepID=UPI003F4801A7